MQQAAPVAVVGTDCICAAGKTLEHCMETMLGKRQSQGPATPKLFTCEQPKEFPVFEVPSHWLAKQNKKYSRTMQLLQHATQNAFAGAGLTTTHLKALRVGVCIGTSVGASLNFLDFYKEYKAGATNDLEAIYTYMRSNPAAALAQSYGFTGPVQSVVNACSSGTDAIGMGATWIRQGLCDFVVAGGTDELSEISYNGFARLMITSTEQCRPFDKNRHGLNLGEGAAVLLLASDAAMQNLVPPARAYVLGYGTLSDAHHLTAPHPEGKGLEKAIDIALAQSDLTYDSIDFINVHGTGTPTNDAVEGALLQDKFPQTPFVATKGYTGHTLGAAGALEAALTIASLEQKVLPGCQGFSEMDPSIGCSPVMQTTPIQATVAMSQSLAFGGNNSTIILQRGEL